MSEDAQTFVAEALQRAEHFTAATKALFQNPGGLAVVKDLNEAAVASALDVLELCAMVSAARDEVARLNATIVRLSKRESVSGLCEVGYDKVTCIEADETHRRIYHGGSPVPDYAKQWSGLNPGGED